MLFVSYLKASLKKWNKQMPRRQSQDRLQNGNIEEQE
jgi:hypothetical protein